MQISFIRVQLINITKLSATYLPLKMLSASNVNVHMMYRAISRKHTHSHLHIYILTFPNFRILNQGKQKRRHVHAIYPQILIHSHGAV